MESTIKIIAVAETEPEIIKDMGTNMDESDYQKLAGSNNEWEITEEKAKIYINREFGFEASRIKIVSQAETYCKDKHFATVYQRYTRIPQYCSTDYNYIRFDVNGWQYEVVDGSLHHYYNESPF